MNKTDFRELPEELDTSRTTDTIFLRQVVTGSHITLFYYRDKVKTRFFIAETNSVPVELKYYQYLSGFSQIVNSPIYQGQLLVYINRFRPGNDRLKARVERINYTDSDLESIVDEINDNKTSTKKKSSRFYAGLSVSSTTTRIYGANYVAGSQTATSVSPQINFGVDIFNNPNIQQFIFRVELYFSYARPRLKYAGVTGFGPNDTYSFDQYTGTIAPQLLFNVYNTDKIKIYIDGALAFNFSGYANNEPNFDGVTTTNVAKLENYWASFPLQAGVVLNKKLEFCFTYMGYATYTKYVGFSVANQATNLGVKYYLWH